MKKKKGEGEVIKVKKKDEGECTAEWDEINASELKKKMRSSF